MLTHAGKNEAVQEVVTLLSGPIIGLTYVVCLPIIGIATVIIVMGKKGVGGFLELLRTVAALGWRPSEACLIGSEKKGRTVLIVRPAEWPETE